MPRRVVFIGVALILVAVLAVWRSDGRVSNGDSPSQLGETSASSSAETSSNDPSPAINSPTRITASGGNPSAVAIAQVSGLVTFLDSGEPATWVDVIFETRDGESAVTSDENGRYSVELAAGQYALRAIGEGVIAKAMPVLRIGGAATVKRNIVVARLAKLSGRVIGSDGAGIAGVEILLRNDTRNGKAFPNGGEIGATTSESDGSFELQVPPGNVDLSATLESTTVFSSVADVPAGVETSGVEIVLDRRGEIAGRVVLPGGAPAADSEVLVSYRREGTSQFDTRTASTDSSGSFGFDRLAPTVYVLEALLPGHAPSAPVSVTLTAESLEADVELSLSKPASLSGKVVDAEGRPVGNARVAQVWIGSKQRFEKLETYASGEFDFSMVGPGPHVLRARKEGYADATLRGVMAPKSDVVLTLVASGGLEGTMLDAGGGPVNSFTVEVIPKGKKTGESSRHRSKDGSFQLYPLSPGTYTVVISSKGLEPQTLGAVVVPSGGYGDASATLTAP
ncbi:MAG: carboxypeptidase regulatory-like domain-containing protein [Myxococcales bacterium]|nr:carboxypeptidase regulatory-like domain-containing protein [Myxococcales bacterium]